MAFDLIQGQRLWRQKQTRRVISGTVSFSFFTRNLKGTSPIYCYTFYLSCNPSISTKYNSNMKLINKRIKIRSVRTRISPLVSPLWTKLRVNPACWQTPAALHQLTSGKTRKHTLGCRLIWKLYCTLAQSDTPLMLFTSSSSRALSSCLQSSSLSLSALSTTHTSPSVLSK